MPTVHALQAAFSGGEVSAELFGRGDDPVVFSGLERCQNFITLPQGPAVNRSGFGFVHEVKYSNRKTRLLEFTYSVTQTMIIEAGHRYFRFHTRGATLLAGNGTPYEVVTPYDEDDLFELQTVQSADVLTLVHHKYAPRELRRLGAQNWDLRPINFSPQISPPTGLSVSVHRAGKDENVNATDWNRNLETYKYKVSAVEEGTLEESLPSAAVVAENQNLLQTGAKNTLTWTAVPGAVRYNVYKFTNGLFGYIGQSSDPIFIDDNIAGDISRTPGRRQNPFNGVNKYPGAVSYFEQRRCFAGSLSQPQNVWMTRSGTEKNLNYSIPSRDDDAINFRVAAREANLIRHIVPLESLILLTDAAEWRVTTANSDALTPTSFSVRPQAYVGASSVKPVIVNTTLVYAASRGGHLRELGYKMSANGYVSGDLCVRAAHLFDNRSIVDMTFAKTPHPIIWCVSSDGGLLGLTYMPEQAIGGWHRHTTQGVFESVASVDEGETDVVYALIRRQINGQSKRYIERMVPRNFAQLSDCFFVDSGLTLRSNTPVTTLRGLDHLEGKTVAILADGAVMPQAVVHNGTVTLTQPARVIHVGLPIDAQLKTPPVRLQSQALGQTQGLDRVKAVNKVTLRLNETSGVFAGPSSDALVEMKQRSTEPLGAPPNWKSGQVDIALTPGWARDGSVVIAQKNPLPVTLISLALEVSVGG